VLNRKYTNIVNIKFMTTVGYYILLHVFNDKRLHDDIKEISQPRNSQQPSTDTEAICSLRRISFQWSLELKHQWIGLHGQHTLSRPLEGAL
jgi:hypothetical protein